MHTQNQNQFMLIFRGTDWTKGLSAEEAQQVMGQWMNWFKGLSEQGKVLSGNPLGREGRLVSGKNGRVVADGPFAESKEAIGGYFMLQVNTLDEAVTVAQQCPALPYGIQVEVRPIAEQCPMAAEIMAKSEELAHA